MFIMIVNTIYLRVYIYKFTGRRPFYKTLSLEVLVRLLSMEHEPFGDKEFAKAKD